MSVSSQKIVGVRQSRQESETEVIREEKHGFEGLWKKKGLTGRRGEAVAAVSEHHRTLLPSFLFYSPSHTAAALFGFMKVCSQEKKVLHSRGNKRHKKESRCHEWQKMTDSLISISAL